MLPLTKLIYKLKQSGQLQVKANNKEASYKKQKFIVRVFKLFLATLKAFSKLKYIFKIILVL